MSNKKIEIPQEKLAAYDRLIAANPDIERKGVTNPYTSVNGHMFTHLGKDGTMGMRLPKEEREAFTDVVAAASSEIRAPIAMASPIVIVVFIPFFFLSGMEGRLFRPVGIAYIVSILSSLLVSLTVTPVLSYWLLGNARLTESEKDSFFLRGLKWIGERVIRFSLAFPRFNIAVTLLAVALAGLWFPREHQQGRSKLMSFGTAATATAG